MESTSTWQHEPVDPSWSEETTPSSSEVIEEVFRNVRPTPPPKPRVHRSVQRRRPREGIRDTRMPQGIVDLNLKPLHAGLQNHDSAPTTSFAFVTAASPLPHLWNGTGFILEEEDEMDVTREESEDLDSLLEPKIESPDNEVLMDDLQEAGVPTRVGNSSSSSLTKRPRGRPRKHPVQSLESLAKVAKGRSKTGCITCRKRKKKCDEAKPRCKFRCALKRLLPWATWLSIVIC